MCPPLCWATLVLTVCKEQAVSPQCPRAPRQPGKEGLLVHSAAVCRSSVSLFSLNPPLLESRTYDAPGKDLCREVILQTTQDGEAGDDGRAVPQPAGWLTPLISVFFEFLEQQVGQEEAMPAGLTAGGMTWGLLLEEAFSGRRPTLSDLCS